MLHGDVRFSKASPVKYFESFLFEYSPNVRDKWVVMDQGGELYNNPLVRNVFKKYDYTIYPTGADNSSQNGPVEQSHCTVSQGVKAILIGAGLDIKFWPLAFNHIIRIRNAIPGQGQLESPLKMSTGSKENLKNLRVFGSRVWVRSPGIQARRFKDKARKGIFLGYVPHNTRNIIWYDVGSERMKIASHCVFDEGFNDVPVETLPPNVQHFLRSTDNNKRPTADPDPISNTDLEFYVYPFAEKEIAIATIPDNNNDRTFDFQLGTDELYNRVYVKRNCSQILCLKHL
jgi:hypothetical protein